MTITTHVANVAQTNGSNMDANYTDQRVGNWTDWIGQPMLYDAGLYVNRTPEEHKMSDLYWKWN